jgi:hypothetical protein
MTDLSMVEQRFHEILKRRLTLQTESHLPLYPWESKIQEYPTEITDKSFRSKVPFWFPDLALPIKIPVNHLNQILEACIEIIDSFGPQALQTVRVVKQIFADQLSLDQLNFLEDQAGIINLAGVTRSAAILEKNTENYGDYEDCTWQQQMTVSLLAAQRILSALTLNLSSFEPSLTKEWATDEGKITVKADYIKENRQLDVIINTFCEGEISWHNQEQNLTVRCNNSEATVIHFYDVEPETVYPINIDLSQNNLTFVLKVENE